MADPLDDSGDGPDISGFGEQFVAGALRALAGGELSKFLNANVTQKEAMIKAFALKSLYELLAYLAAGWHDLEDKAEPLLGVIVQPSLAGLFGAKVDAADVGRRMGAGGGQAVAASIIDGYMGALTGGATGEIAASPDGAKRLATAAVQATLEAELNALLPELLSCCLPDFPGFRDLLQLPESVIRSLGVSRLVRRALAPLVDATAAGPMKRWANTTYRPTQLAASMIAKQVVRQRWSMDDALTALAEQGYSDDACEALLNDAAKFLSAADLARLVRARSWSEDDAHAHLNDQGYDDAVADALLQLLKLSAIESFERSMADAAVEAYVSGRIDAGALDGGVRGATISDQETAQYKELANARRTFGQKALTSAEAEALVLAGILSPLDYRDALARENRTPDAIDALELGLRVKQNKEADVARLRAQQAADKAAKTAAAQAAALAAKAAADKAAAVKALGPAADIEQAVIRGLVSIARLEEIYEAKYSGDTAGILVSLVEAKRQDYLDQQAARASVVKNAAGRGVSVSELDAAVLAGVLTIGDYRARLASLSFAGSDIDLLASTLQAKIDAAAAAKALRASAATVAAAAHVPLAQMEQLVRRGHRTMADYDALLAGLGYADAARAAMEELLQLQIDDAAAAAQARADAAAKSAIKALSLEQWRRAVILDLKSLTDFQTYLVGANYTPEAQVVLVGELRQDVADADAARQRRAATSTAVDSRLAPLADVARAARLGLIALDDYVARLRAAGYTDADIAIEQDLLVEEIAQVKDAEAARAAADAAAAHKGLNLAQTEAAVVDGALPMSAYGAALAAAGYTGDAAAVLEQLAQDKADNAAAAARRRAILIAQDAGRTVSIADFEKAVLSGARTMADYVAQLQALGYGPDDIDLLTGLLQTKLDAAAAKAAG